MRGKGRAGLIHNDKLRFEQQRLCNFYQLFLRGIQIAHQHIQVDVYLHAFQHLGAAALHLLFTQQAAPADFIAQIHIFKHF